MNFLIKQLWIKQAALLLLCGLLHSFCFAQPRNISDATQIANKFSKDNLMLTKNTDMVLRVFSSKVLSGLTLRADKEAYYIFTSDNKGKGFVVVSGDRRMPDVLAYSDQSDFDIDNIPPSVRYWLDCYEEAFLLLNESDKPALKRLEAVNHGGVTPLLGDNSWGQGDPYNRRCPSVRYDKCVTGCVATAMAQVMNYHRYPNVGKGIVNYYTTTNSIHLQENLSLVQLYWDKMLSNYENNYTLEEANAIAGLMYACGTSVQMDYCTLSQGGSGAYQKDLIPAFVGNFGYDNDAAFLDRRYCALEDWHQILINELNEGRPVNYAGQSTRDGGHSFVIDGYKENVGGFYPYYHVNWGWNGSCNGYYQIADLHPREDEQYATDAGFNSGQQMTIGIKPEDGIDDGYAYLSAPNFYVSSSTVKPGGNLKVYSASCVNFSYKPFVGSLYVALVSMEDGVETILGEKRIPTLNYLQEQRDFSLDITLPYDLLEGQYTVQLRSKLFGQNIYQKVLSKQYPTLSVSSTDITPEVQSETILGCSELEVLTTQAPSMINIKIYELQNLSKDPFSGDLKMILSDVDGKQLCSFGDSVFLGGFISNEVQVEPVTLQGQLTGDWPDGDYKLYVGARQINSSKYEYIYLHDYTHPEIACADLSLNARIKDGRISINGTSYIILPTSVREKSAFSPRDFNECSDVYRLDGRYMGKFSKRKSLQPGIYILRYQGKTSKIFL